MKIVHSNINLSNERHEAKTAPVFKMKQMSEKERFAYEMALKGHKRALKKYAKQIAEVQDIFPGWEPEFKYPINQ